MIGENMRNLISAVFLMMIAQYVVAGENVPPNPGQLTMLHHSVMVENYNAIEAESLRISLDKNLKGFVEGKVCDSCEEIKVTITPQTKAYENRKEVPLKKAEARIGRYATVIYEVKTKQVVSIRW